MLKKYGLFAGYTLILVLVVALLSSGLTMLLSRSRSVAEEGSVTISRDEYDTLRRYLRLDQFRGYIQHGYIEEIDDDTLMTGAMQGMFYSLNDPYSFYMTPEQTAAATQEEVGIYHGIGCQLIVDPDDALITVTRVYKDSPAMLAGIAPGDKIVRVFGEAVTGYELNEAVSKIKGEPGTSTEITIRRGDEMIEMTIARAEVTVDRVEVRMLEDGIGMITIYEFEGNVVASFKEALKSLEKEKAKGMIIDLRGNPGGSLDAVVSICDMLLPECTIVTVEDRYGNVEEYTSDPSMTKMPLTVLINEMSASASEILAGCVKDHKIGTLVGMQTFGKGIVQSVYVFKDDNSSIHLTTAKYFTPSGENIHKIGIAPDRVVDLPEELKINPTKLTDENDTQLATAIEEVKKLIDRAE